VTSTVTLPAVRAPEQVRRARTKRRIGIAALAVFVLAGATGLFGTRTGTTSATGGGYTVAVTHPTVSRPGHAVRYEVKVTHPGGFDGPIRMRFSREYFNLFDENSFGPDADSETTTGAYTIYEFSPPPGDTFVVSSDTRVEPARQRGEKGEVSVLDDSGRPVVTVRYRTRIMP
jgi:hypothetical protein